MTRLGNSLLGDKVYGKSKKLVLKTLDSQKIDFINNFGRQALHAKTLGFVHPRTEQKMVFNSDFPEDFEKLINYLNEF